MQQLRCGGGGRIDHASGEQKAREWHPAFDAEEGLSLPGVGRGGDSLSEHQDYGVAAGGDYAGAGGGEA